MSRPLVNNPYPVIAAAWRDHAHGKPPPPTADERMVELLAEHLASWISGSTALIGHYRPDAERLVAQAYAAGIRFDLAPS